MNDNERKAYYKAYYQKNKEKYITNNKKYQKTDKYKIHQKAYYQKNKEKVSEKNKAYRLKNIEKCKTYNRSYQKTDKNKASQKAWYQKNKEKCIADSKKYYKNNKTQRDNYKKEYRKINIKREREYIRNYIKQKRLEDPSFMIGTRLRCLLNSALNHYTKTGKIMSSKKYGIEWNSIIEHLIATLPFNFKDNPSGWHIDHIKPCCSFDLTDPEQIKKCFSSDNLQWLSEEENLSKGGRLV